MAAFNARIAGKDEQRLQDNLRLAATSEGTGVQQQWVMSCQATTVQAARAEIDPIYALSLRDASPQLHELIPQENTRLATEQKQMLESAVVEDLNAGYQQGVAQRLATESPADAAALQALIDNAASNWEKNQVMEVIARPQKYTTAQIDAYYKANVQGKNTGGKAVHKTDQNSAAPPGGAASRWTCSTRNRPPPGASTSTSPPTPPTAMRQWTMWPPPWSRARPCR